MLSSGVPIEHGIYQGSPLGPLLFIIYINDMAYASLSRLNIFCNMYADDTVIVKVDICKADAIRGICLAFKQIQEWCVLNNIRVNIRKTKHMLCGPRGVVCESGDLDCMDGVANVENFVYLGVTIDKNLNFEKFVGATIQKVNGRLITLAKIRKLMDVQTSLLIYKQTILPILDYVSVLVNSSIQRQISNLQPLQNKAVQIIKKITGYISTADMKSMHKDLNLKWLDNRQKFFYA